MSAKGDMLAGKWYNANFDTELIRERTISKDLCMDLNSTHMADLARRRELLREILPNVEVEQVEILSPFIVDYGYNVYMGSGCFVNHNVYMMDCAKITFGKIEITILPSLPPFFARNAFIYWGSRTGGKTNIPPVSLPSRVPCFQNGRERTKKREGNGRDNHSPSRASNALYIGI